MSDQGFGYAVQDREGNINMRTVSPTIRGAIVNWLYAVPKYNVTTYWTDDMIFDRFKMHNSLGECHIIAVEVIKTGVGDIDELRSHHDWTDDA